MKNIPWGSELTSEAGEVGLVRGVPIEGPLDGLRHGGLNGGHKGALPEQALMRREIP
jgi:hypothetical protein